MSADDPTGEEPVTSSDAPRTREAWQHVRTMLDDLTRVVDADAESDLDSPEMTQPK